jgi:hypothetical protein
MLDPPMSSAILHRWFALVRAGMARLEADPRAALHAPVKTEREDAGFRLHCDLFLTERLWVIFDSVGEKRCGRTLLLPRRNLDAAIARNRLVPASERRRLQALLDRRVHGDGFDEFYDWIHSPANPWTRSLSRRMNRERWAIRLYRGEGYMLDDRRWLHGRTSVKGSVSTKRFRRLVYGRARSGWS